MGNRFNKPIRDQQGGGASSSSVGKIVTPNLKVFTFAELKSATKNFQPVKMLGDGGIGRFYKGWIDETLAPSKSGVGMAVVVKKYSPDNSHQGINQWKTEVNFLGKFSHPNLVRLFGYCEEHDRQCLVYEYLLNGSLEDHLFSPRVEPLPWGTRIRIAMDVARGLAFLHNNPEDTVIYRDVKPANISLDEKYGAKLSNFELATMGPSNDDDSHMSTEVVGTYGYAAPEYIATGHLYVKSDVYGFGVVLLEILTGLRSVDRNRPSSEHNLVEKYKPILQNRGKLKKMIDPRMGEYPPEGAHKLALLIKRCLEKVQGSRPSMSEVLLVLERISTISVKPKKPKGSS